MANKTEFS